MTDFVVDRNRITKEVLNLIDPEWGTAEFDAALGSWWVNRRSSGGLGLTPAGFNAFVGSGLEYWSTDLDAVLWPGTTLKIDQYLLCPYHINRKLKGVKTLQLHIFDSRVFVTMQLHGSLKAYLDNLHTKRINLLSSSQRGADLRR